MKVAIAVEGRTLGAAMASVFGRCPCFLLVDSITGDVEALPNPARGSSGGAGVEAARFVVGAATEVVIAPKVGPKAATILEGAGIRVEQRSGGSARQALTDFLGRKPA